MAKSRIYLDTNVVVDFLISNRKTHLAAVSLFKTLDAYEVFISEDILTTIFYLDRNKSQVLSFFKKIVIKKWHVSAFGTEVIRNAINLSLENNLDFEDVLQCLCAKANHCDYLITNDKVFYNCDLTIVSTDEFLQQQKKL